MIQQEIRGTISKMMIYAVKGCAGKEVDETIMTKAGFQVPGMKDHEYMIVKAKPNEQDIHPFITQRNEHDRVVRPQGFPDLAKVKPIFSPTEFGLNWMHNMNDSIQVPKYEEGHEISVQVWETITRAVDQGDEVAIWLSDHLNYPVRLVRASGPWQRMARQNYSENDSRIGTPDGYPGHDFTAASVRELKDRGGIDFPWQQFRPQIVFEGFDPQAEHLIKRGTINGLLFEHPNPCGRCGVIRVNQETGEIGPDPKMTLAKYKQWKDKDGKNTIIFGENILPLEEGIISIEDPVVSIELRNPPLVYGGSTQTTTLIG